MVKEIKEYLEGTRNYNQGVAIYQMYGVNKALKASFRRQGETELTRNTLFEELRKLAGISDIQFKNMKRHVRGPVQEVKRIRIHGDDFLLGVAQKLGIPVEELVSESYSIPQDMENKEEFGVMLESARAIYEKAPEPVRKMIGFREKYPFLKKPDCPDILKVLVADMFAAYDNYREAFLRLQENPDPLAGEETFDLARTTVESYLENREIWEELDHYKEKGEILGKHLKIKELQQDRQTAFSDMTDLELTKAISNASSNVSKAKKSLEEATSDKKKIQATENHERWTKTLSDLREELDKRKK